MATNQCNAKLVLEYPCAWVYKLIGPDREQLEAAIAAITTPRACTVTPSRTSRTGKYLCLDVELTVQSEAERESLHAAFKSHPAVTIVL